MAGAMAVKSYAWWHATHSHKHITGPGGVCYDVDATAVHQAYTPFLEDADTNAAVDATWDFYMIEGSGLGADVVQAFYKQGLEDPEDDETGDACGQWTGPPPAPPHAPAPGNDMSQYGSQACAEDGVPWFFILTTYYFPLPVSWALLGASGDNDSDGCTNGEEAGNNEAKGGRRNPLYFWDFYDTPDPALPPGPPDYQRDRIVTVPDILRVAGRFGTTGNRFGDPLAAAPATGYHTGFDRGAIIGPNFWNRAPADGIVVISDDILAVAAQFGHTCG